MRCFLFQSPDGDFVYSDDAAARSSPTRSWFSFNPLTGISSILTGGRPRGRAARGIGFNPLTGISSILTRGQDEQHPDISKQFQSPDGDFVYSDKVHPEQDPQGLEKVSIP